ncbi:2,4-dichlorophenol 6-monooxygenase (FAD binding domain-containing protein) [Botrytis cinerea]
MVSEHQIPILIIGGGIVGLSASLFLSQHGIQSLLIERHSGTSIHPRARSVNARTMELFHGLGIDDLVREAGASMKATMGIHKGKSLKEVIEAKKPTDGPRKFPLAGLMDPISPVKGTFVTQDMLEPVLVDVARERGGDLRFYTECVGIHQDSDSVTATLKDRETGAISSVHAEYLIAADGAGSPIRNRLNVPTSGQGTMGYLLNILFHADLKSLVHKREFSICVIERPEIFGAFTSINNDDRWVFHLAYDPSKGKQASEFTPERCIELLRIAIGIPDLEIDHGRIFLAGDAAHQMPPWGGQGANSGITDAHNLAWKLALVLQKQANKRLLETYNAERQPVGKTAAEVSASGSDKRGMISLNLWDPAVIVGFYRRMGLISGHGYIYASDAICAENTSPLGGLTWKPWKLASLFFLIDGRPGMTGAKGEPWIEATNSISETLAIDILAYSTGPNGDLITETNIFETTTGISPQGAILVRPDGFIAWRARRQESSVETPRVQLELAIRRVLCLV